MNDEQKRYEDMTPDGLDDDAALAVARAIYEYEAGQDETEVWPEFGSDRDSDYHLFCLYGRLAVEALAASPDPAAPALDSVIDELDGLLWKYTEAYAYYAAAQSKKSYDVMQGDREKLRSAIASAIAAAQQPQEG